MALPDLKGLADLTKSRLMEVTMEFYQLQKLDIFNREELGDLMQKLIFYEAKINGEERSVANCVQYIEYQLHLLKTIQVRALEKPGVNKDAVELKIINKIKVAYQEAIKEFTDDNSLHNPYIKFCIRINSKDDVVQWCIHFLKNNITNDAIWITLNDLYSNESDEIMSDMWGIMTDFANKFTSDILKQTDEPGNGNTCLKRLGELFSMAFKHIRCSYFHISLLDSIKDDDVMKQLLIDFRQNVFMWNALAQRLWRVDIKTEPGIAVEIRSPKTRLEQSIAKYKEGIACLLPENKSGLWCILMNFLFVVYEDSENAISNSFKLNIIKTLLTEGMPYFSEIQFLKWLKLEEDPIECLHISEKAVAILPNSVELWRARLKYEFCKTDTSNARALFYVAIGHLKENSLPLWKDMIQYTILTNGQDSLENLYWEGSKQCHEVSSKIRPMFLEWVALRKRIKDVRSIFYLLVELPPQSKEMYAMMAKIENILAEEFNEETAENVHVIACKHFGTDIEVRLNYMRFLLSLNSRGVPNLSDRIRVALSDSLAALPSHLHEEFKSRYAELLRATTF